MTQRALAIGFLSLLLVMTACSTHQVSVKSAPQLELASSIEVQLQHVPNEHTREGPVDEQLLKDLSRHVRGELLQRGFEVDPGSPVRLEIDVHAFKPGNTAARILVGFGAGRASLLYTARYVSEDGELLAQLDGSERHTGSEVYGLGEVGGRHGMFAAYAGADKTRQILLFEAARHIVAVLK
jgi:hypothetical protein